MFAMKIEFLNVNLIFISPTGCSKDQSSMLWRCICGPSGIINLL